MRKKKKGRIEGKSPKVSRERVAQDMASLTPYKVIQLLKGSANREINFLHWIHKTMLYNHEL